MKNGVGWEIKIFLFGLFLVTPGISMSENNLSPDQNETLIRDYLQVQTSSKEMAIALWYAEPIWESMGIEQMASLSEENKNEYLIFLKLLRPCTIMLIVHGKPNGKGGMKYSDAKWVRKHATLIGRDGKKYKPLPPKKWPLNLDVFLNAARSEAMSSGNLPSDMKMHFIVFPNIDKNGKVIMDYRYPGSVNLRVGGSTLIWQTPILPNPGKRFL